MSPKKTNQKIRNKVIRIRTTSTELEDIDRLAKKDGLNRSEYVRRKIQSDVDVSVIHPEIQNLVNVLENLSKELSPIGNNLNQLARHVNTAVASGQCLPDYAKDPEGLEELRNDVWSLNDAIKGLILEVKPKQPRKRNKVKDR